MSPTPSAQRLRRGLPGYLILFATHAFAPQRQYWPRDPPSPPVFLLISAHFTATPGIPISLTRSCDPEGVSGISSPFGELSRSLGQVPHVLLTRSPLGLHQCCHWMDPA